jgi:hypothetical protein
MGRLFELQMVLTAQQASKKREKAGEGAARITHAAQVPRSSHNEASAIVLPAMYAVRDGPGSLLSELFKNCCHKIYSKCATGTTAYQFPHCVRLASVASGELLGNVTIKTRTRVHYLQVSRHQEF